MEARQVQEEPPHAVTVRLSGREVPVLQEREHQVAVEGRHPAEQLQEMTQSVLRAVQELRVRMGVRGRHWEEPGWQELLPVVEPAAAVVVRAPLN
jgi:hypothetical protein